MGNEQEEIRALISLKCECRFLCKDGTADSKSLLPLEKKNVVRSSCKGCVSLGMGRIIAFYPD